MERSEEFLENRILWKGSKYNLPNRSARLFEYLPEEDKEPYLSLLKPLAMGKILWLFKNPKGPWTVVGTRMVAGFNGNVLEWMTLKSIREVTSKNLRDSGLRGFASGEMKKRQEHKLSVIDIGGRENVFVTNTGNDFFALWNILAMIATFNQSE